MRIAIAMQKDSTEMKDIARISRKIAVNTAKDSAAMRSIADVTMLFLPLSYVAVMPTDSSIPPMANREANFMPDSFQLRILRLSVNRI